MPTTVAVDTAQQVLDKYRPVMTNLSENYPKAKSFGTLSIFIIAPKMAFGMLEIVLHPHFSLSLSPPPPPPPIYFSQLFIHVHVGAHVTTIVNCHVSQVRNSFKSPQSRKLVLS